MTIDVYFAPHGSMLSQKRLNRAIRTAMFCAGLMCLSMTLHAQSYNPTLSDSNDNTAGGSHAQPSESANLVARNTAFGSNALGNNQNVWNSAFGAYALASNSQGSSNTAVGTDALFANTAGVSNTAVGTLALEQNTSGNQNTAIGEVALETNTTGEYNVAVGAQSLSANSTGSSNSATGYSVLESNTTGTGNSGNGASALASNTTGFLNSAFGLDALYSNTTGNLNIAVGGLALESNATGANNVAVGYYALGANSSGGSNLALGFEAGQNLQTGSNNIYIGSPGGSAGENGFIRIGTNGTQKSAFVAGVTGVTVSGVPVLINSSGQLGVQTSSARFKQDITPMGDRTAALMELRPVTFHYKQDPQGDLEYGLVAEEVARVYPELAVKDADGQVQTIRYQELTPMMLNEMQKLAREINEKDAQIETLRREGESQVRALQQEINELEVAHRQEMSLLTARTTTPTRHSSPNYSGE